MNNGTVRMICLHLGLLWIGLTTVYGQSCDLTLTANSFESSQSAVVGSSETCTWIITTLSDKYPGDQLNEYGDTTYTVRIRVRVVNLTNHATCDVTNSITVYDGDTSGPILGLVCGNYMPTFQSSGRSLVIKYPASELTETSNFTIKYQQMHPGADFCQDLWVVAVSSTESNILSPMYPNGMQTSPYSCTWWVLRSADKERVHISIDTGRTECSDVNVTIFDAKDNELGNWCPGKENRFQGWTETLRLRVRMTPGEGIRVKYRALEASPCVATLNATTEEQFLTTPNYPGAFTSFTECRWLIDNWSNSRNENTIRLEVVDMDMEDTEGCVTDSLRIRDGQFDSDPVIATICDTERSFFKVYKFTAEIVFKSVRESNTRTGIKIKYFLSEAEPCGGNLTANSTIQSIQSPGYPISIPRSMGCAWTITPGNPNNYVEVEILEYDSSSSSSSCYEDRLSIYDGSSVSAYQLAELCRTPASRVFQGTEEAMFIVFGTTSYARTKGFKMTYKESEGPMQFHRRLRVRISETFLMSPRYPDRNVRDMDSTWTFSSDIEYIPNQIMLTFTDVNIGHVDDCSNNYIKVFNGNTSSPQSSTLCGTETGVYLSTGAVNLLTVVMKTDNIPSPRGFQAKYDWLFAFKIPGCNGTAVTNVAYSMSTNVDVITTPNYPNPYPNFAECSHILKPVLSQYFLRVNIVDADFAGPTDCSRDYIEIFDGNTTTANRLGRICQNTSKTFESTRPGTNMLIRFISDSNLVAKGAKISYEAFSKESSGVPLWIPIFVSVLVGVILIGIIVVCFVKYGRKTGSGTI